MEDVQLQVQAADFLRRRASEEAVLDIVFLFGTEFLQCIGPDVMIGNEQAVTADETARAAGIEADGGFLQVVEPDLGGVELIAFAQQGARRLVEEPHPFIAGRRQTRRQAQQT